MTILENSNIKKVAIYMRVSTDEQAREGFSLDQQLDRLRNHCRGQEWEITKEYVDGGYSGRNTKRPQYQQMMADMDQWDGLVVIKMDRIHRNQKNFTHMIERLNKNRKHFVSMTESYDTSNAMGRFFVDLVSRLNQLESEITGERVFDGLKHKAKTDKGGWMGHDGPFGYIWNVDDQLLIEEPEKLAIVKKVFEIYDEMNKEDYHTRQGISLRDLAKKVHINFSQVTHIIHNPFYAGFDRWDTILRPISAFGVKPIVSLELFDSVQKKLHKRMRSSNGVKKEDHEPLFLQNLIGEQKNPEDIIELKHEDLENTGQWTRPRPDYNL